MLDRVTAGGAKPLSCLVLTSSLLFAATPAHAQIYTWRDANGQLVLSNIKPTTGVETRSYAVPQAQAIRTTRYATTERGRVYDDLIAEHAQLNRVRADLVRAVMQVESAFNPRAQSPKGALGLMQLMPATLRQYNVRNPFDPSENVRAGVAYLRELLDRYQNNEQLALAAYNAGPGAVDRHGQTVPPYRETQNYVSQINQMTKRSIESRGQTIYKVAETIDGRAVPLYTDKKATGGVPVAGR